MLPLRSSKGEPSLANEGKDQGISCPRFKTGVKKFTGRGHLNEKVILYVIQCLAEKRTSPREIF